MFVPHDNRGGAPTLEADEAHVWRFDLDVPPAARADWTSLLSPNELDRHSRFRTDELQDRYLAAHARCRMLLGTYLGIDPAAVVIDVGASGKPLLNHEGWHFNLSHSQDQCLVALTRRAAIGVDVEYKAREVDREGIAARYFSAAERTRLHLAPAENRNEIFYRLWTAKEAWLKATGAGIAGGLDRVEFAVNDDFSVKLGMIFEDGQSVEKWTIGSFDVTGEFVGAVAIGAPGVKVRRFDSA